MGRRGKGKGSIYRDADGKWRGYVDLGREVGTKLREAANQRDAGVLVAGRLTLMLGRWMEFWLESIAAAKVRPSTLHLISL
jgi:integrase